MIPFVADGIKDVVVAFGKERLCAAFIDFADIVEDFA